MRVYKHRHKMIRIIYCYYNVMHVMLARVNVCVRVKQCRSSVQRKQWTSVWGVRGRRLYYFSITLSFGATRQRFFLSPSLSLFLSRFLSCILFFEYFPTPPRTIELCPAHIIIRLKLNASTTTTTLKWKNLCVIHLCCGMVIVMVVVVTTAVMPYAYYNIVMIMMMMMMLIMIRSRIFLL